MRYILVCSREIGGGEKHHKWVPGPQYNWSAEYLLKLIRKKPKDFDFLVVPFVLALSASLEADLNDWLVIDTFDKHGPANYKPIAEAYMGAQFSRKLRLAVAVLTDNNFQLREDSPIVKKLDELIAVRNKITHPLTFFEVEETTDKTDKLLMPKVDSHPLQRLTKKQCREYYLAVGAFDRLFFKQYDHGVIYENKLVRQIERPSKSKDSELMAD